MQQDISTSAPACRVCRHKQRGEVEQRLYEHSTLLAIGTEFHLTYRALYRHAHEHMSPPVPTRTIGQVRKYRNSVRADEDGESVWLKLLPFKLDLWTRVDCADLKLAQHTNWRVVHHHGQYRVWALKYTHNDRHVLNLGRLITGVTDEHLQVDHVNHDALDNRRRNLRVVTNAQNHQNYRGAMSNSRSGVRGVYRITKRKVPYWQAQVKVNARPYTRQFPFSDDGLAAAAEWVTAKRRELMPYSSADQT